MTMRIISAIVLLPLFLIVLFVLPPVFLVTLVAAIAAVGSWELLYGTGIVKNVRLAIYASVTAFVMVFIEYFGLAQQWTLLTVVVFTMLVFAELMISHMEIGFEKAAVCLTGGLVMAFLFASLARIRAGEHGKMIVALPFLISFVSDSGAYFAGRFLGKHKLAPQISPKKTIEGAIGGAVAAIIGMLIFCFIMQMFFGFKPNYIAACVYGLVGAAIGVFGDLSFSVIKRQTGIKDYGHIIPGHGGVLDRFDSTLFITPVVELLMIFWPVLVK